MAEIKLLLLTTGTLVWASTASRFFPLPQYKKQADLGLVG